MIDIWDMTYVDLYVLYIYIYGKNTNDVTSCYDMVKYAIYMV